ncbi:MAG TPA: TonB-dependent receptor [Terriglobales bacterium]|nr:TonB-dependent receptor [Terriglobales bacterium]
MTRKLSSILAIGMTLLLGANLAFAQGIVTGTITGTVEDQQGAVISGATVTAREVNTNREFKTESDATGRFSLRALPVGTYRVSIEAANFNKLTLEQVPVNIARDTDLGARTLTVGATEVVNVESTPPQIESTTTQISSTFQSKDVTTLPVGTGFDSLALLVPGVASAGDAGFSNNNGADISANGQRGRSNNFLVDGQSNNDNSIAGPLLFIGNPDVVGEFQIITNYSAEFGRNVGSVINYVTKNGTNAFHGTLFEFHQNSLFDSHTNEEKSGVFGFCQSGQDPVTTGCTPVEKAPKYIDNKFGGTIGGPIVRDKMWFFASQYWQRIRTAGATFSSAPFSTPTPAGIAALQAAFPGNTAVAALSTFGPYSVPVGTTATAGTPTTLTVSDGVTSVPVEFAPISRFLSQPSNNYELLGRYDWQVTDKDRFFARYLFQKQIFTNASAFSGNDFAAGAFVDVPSQTQQIGVDWTRTFTSRFVNTFRFNYLRADIGFEDGGFAGCSRADLTNCPTRIGLGGLNLAFGQNAGFPQGRLINNSQWQDNASWVLGRHTLKLGGEYVRQRSPSPFLPNINGTFTYSAATAGCPVASGPSGQECAFSRFLQNTTTTFQLADGNPVTNFKEQDVAVYFQDEWRVKDNLTLILGLRYEFFQQAINLLHDQSVARQTGPNPFWDPTLPLDRTTVGAVPNDVNNFAPNVGFAWTPRFWEGLFGKDQTVIRGGFRIAYDPAFYNIFLNVATSAPSLNLGTINTPVAIPAGATTFTGTELRPALLALIPTGAGIDPGFRTWTTVDPNFHNPYSQQWNLGVQRQITNKVAAEVRYVGNHSVGLFQSVNGNPALNTLIANGFGSLIPAGLTPCTDATGGLGGGPMPGFASGYANCNNRNVIQRGNYAFSIYHSLQSRLDIQNWHGLTARINYTFSKTIDNASEVFSTLAGGNTLSFAQNPFDTNRAERAVSGLDFPHLASIALVYELPFYKKQEGLLGRLLGGWQWQTTWRYASGQPLTVAQFKEGLFCDPTNAFSGTFDTCRPIVSNPLAALDSVGRCTDETLADCGLVHEVDGSPASFSDVHWIINDPTAALFFGSPFLGTPRNTVRGETTQAVNLGVYKNTKVSERVTVQFQFLAFNVLNRQFRGTPDPFAQDVATDPTLHSFMNTNFNPSGNGQANATELGISRRRLSFGLKLIF